MSTSDLVGLWRLISYFDLDERDRTTEGPLGPTPRGLLFYSADGYMSVNMMRGGPNDPHSRDSRVYLGYAGTWRLDGEKLVHAIAVCSNPAWAGTDQVREMALDGDRLTLRGAAMVAGKPQRRVLHWQRA